MATMTIGRLNAPGDGPYPFTEDLKACHVTFTLAGAYAAGGIDLNPLAGLYGIHRVMAAICHTQSWCEAATANANGNKIVYGDIDSDANKLMLRQLKADAGAAGDPELNAVDVSDVYLEMTLFGT